MTMTLHAAASFACPTGTHRHRTLAAVALDDPAYLEWLLGEGTPECPEGSPYRAAVEVVLAQYRANLEADILAGRTIDPHALHSAGEDVGALNAVALKPARERRAKGPIGDARAAKAATTTTTTTTPGGLF